jgi:ubiquinone/menaquinone biosynthesis C-methylase UbiE
LVLERARSRFTPPGVARAFYAADVSQAMIAYAKAKAATSRIWNIVFSHGGFLTYEHADKAASAVVTTLVFQRAEFAIKSKALHDGVIGQYLCLRTEE